ncbi:MAG TPA: hypothetical protein VK171_06105 [Fimbriimonas sp.]|nr:hypothetical protein [Fimbriimonas sp.]
MYRINVKIPINLLGILDMSSAQFAPLPPTAATLLVQSGFNDSRSILTVLASDLLVSRIVTIICERIGFDGTFSHIAQSSSPKSLTQLAIACDLWISGSRVSTRTVSSSHMSLGSLVIGVLTPSVLEADFLNVTGDLQMRASSFALFSTLTYSLVARQMPDEFESAASVAQFRKIPISDAFETVAGVTMREVAGRLASAWNLNRELTIALQGPGDFVLSPEEKIIISATETATSAAQSAALSMEPWPYTVKTDKIEQIALIQALGMRARKVAGQLEEKIAELKSAA